MKIKVNITVLSLILALLSHTILAQATYQITDQSKMVIKGTSSLHDWESDVTEIKGKAQVNVENQQPKFQSFSMTIPVKSIESGKSAMDNNTYEALKEKSNPNIQFNLKEIQDVSQGKLKAKGDLTIAGSKKPVAIEGTYTLENTNQISLKGNYSFKMSDFGVDPPTAMFGTIKTGDEITIEYTLQLNKTN